MLKLCAGLVIIGCLYASVLAVIDPSYQKWFIHWIAVVISASAAFWFASIRVRELTPQTVVSTWQGEKFVLAVPWLSQLGTCLLLTTFGLILPLVLLFMVPMTPWQTLGVLLGGAFGFWLVRASLLGLLNMKRAGFALKMDATGIHHPGLPVLLWSHVSGVELDPPHPDSDESQCLVVQMRQLPELPTGLHRLWRTTLPGSIIRRQTISLTLPTLTRRISTSLLSAAKTLWKRHGNQVA